MVERRLAWLAGIVLVWGAAIFFNLISLQIVHHREYAKLATERQVVAVARLETFIDSPGSLVGQVKGALRGLLQLRRLGRSLGLRRRG